MAKAEVKVKISAQDMASPALKKVSGAIKGMIGAWVGIKGIQMVSGAISDSIKKFGVQEQALKKVEAVLKSTGNQYGWTVDELAKMAGAMQKVTAIGDEEILSAQALGLTFTDIGKDIFPDFIKSAADMSQAMGTDMRSAILQLGKAIQDPNLGVSALARVGVNTAQLKAQFTDAMPIQEKQRLIIKEITTEFGGMAEAMGSTLQGRMDRLKNLTGDMQEKIGGAITGTEAWTDTMEFLEDKIEDLSIWLESNQGLIEDFTTTVLTAFQGIADGLFYLGKGVGEFLAAWKELWGAELKQQIEDQEAATRHMLNMQKRYKEQLDKNIISKDTYLEKMAKLREETQLVSGETKRAIIPMRSFGGAIDGVAGSGKNAAKSFEEWGKQLQKVKDLISYEEYLNMIEPLKEITPVISTIGIGVDRLGKSFSDVWVPGIENVTLSTKGMNVKWLEFKETARNATYSFTSSWANNVLGSIWAGNFAFGEFVKNFLSGMAKMALKMAAFKLLRMAFGIPYGGGGVVEALHAQHGLVIPGGAPFTDRVHVMATPGERILSRGEYGRLGGERGLQQAFHNRFNMEFNITGGGDEIVQKIIDSLRTELPGMVEDMERRRQ